MGNFRLDGFSMRTTFVASSRSMLPAPMSRLRHPDLHRLVD